MDPIELNPPSFTFTLAEVGIAVNPRSNPADSIKANSKVYFNNVSNRPIVVSNLNSRPRSGDGCELSDESKITVPPHQLRHITISGCAHGAYFFYVDSTDDDVGDPPQMIVGGGDLGA